MKKIICLLLIIIGLYMFSGVNSYSFAETRAHPYSEEFLRKNVSLIFAGKVLELETFKKWERTVPTRVQVLQSIKGNLKVGAIIDVIPKHPGGRVYFKEEFDQGIIGKVGIFYVGGTKYGLSPNLLVKYKEQPLQLTIKSDKEAYGVGESINIKVEFKNNTDEEIMIVKDIFMRQKVGYGAK